MLKMTKLQSITRKNGTQVFVLYIPLELVDQAHLAKGDELELTYDQEMNEITLKKQ